MADSPSKSSRYASPTMFGSGWVTPYSARMSRREGAVTALGRQLVEEPAHAVHREPEVGR